MATVHLTSEAIRDLHEIWSYVADYDEDAADRLIDKLKLKIRSLSVRPTRVAVYASKTRKLSMTPYLILFVYDEAADSVSVTHIVHGARDLTRIPLREP